jgi:CDP-diacylglycerol pyrophosphatase
MSCFISRISLVAELNDSHLLFKSQSSLESRFQVPVSSSLSPLPFTARLPFVEQANKLNDSFITRQVEKRNEDKKKALESMLLSMSRNHFSIDFKLLIASANIITIAAIAADEIQKFFLRNVYKVIGEIFRLLSTRSSSRARCQ